MTVSLEEARELYKKTTYSFQNIDKSVTWFLDPDTEYYYIVSKYSVAKKRVDGTGYPGSRIFSGKAEVLSDYIVLIKDGIELNKE